MNRTTSMLICLIFGVSCGWIIRDLSRNLNQPPPRQEAEGSGIYSFEVYRPASPTKPEIAETFVVSEYRDDRDDRPICVIRVRPEAGETRIFHCQSASTR